jgi:ribosomal protein S12 methylthiotransferase accessory factor
MSAITIGHVKKRFFEGTHRSKPPVETYQDIAGLMDPVGVTDLVDISRFDRLGIPVACAKRPRAAIGGTRMHPGKGLNELQAEVSAMMGAVERYSAEYRGETMEYTSYEELGIARSVDPVDLILPEELEFGEKIHWTAGWDLLADEEVYVPSNAVFFPYNSLGMARSLFRGDPNGLAGGNDIEEAILYGLLEVIERDALSEAEAAGELGTRLEVDVDGEARRMIDCYEANGIAIHLWLIEGRTGLPVVAAAADDQITKDPAMLVIGSAAHPSPDVAVISALTEVARSRASLLTGGAKSAVRSMVMEKAGYERMKRINRAWFARAGEGALSALPDLSTSSIDGDIAVALNAVSAHSDRVCVCDLTRTTVPVVRVVVPGFSISCLDSHRRHKKKS